MAIDTRSKRASVLGVALAVTLTLPLSDGAVGTADRAHVTGCYAGIAADAPAVVTRSTKCGYRPPAEVRGHRPAAETRGYRPPAETRGVRAS